MACFRLNRCKEIKFVHFFFLDKMKNWFFSFFCHKSWNHDFVQVTSYQLKPELTNKKKNKKKEGNKVLNFTSYQHQGPYWTGQNNSNNELKSIVPNQNGKSNWKIELKTILSGIGPNKIPSKCDITYYHLKKKKKYLFHNDEITKRRT